MTRFRFGKIFTMILAAAAIGTFARAQPPKKNDQKVRPVTVPISIFTKEELRARRAEEFVEAGNLTVKQDGDEQTILSIRSVENTPLQLAILIQDDLSSSFNLELKRLGDFIRHLPRGSRVMVAYLRGGSPQIRQKFTDDLERAADSLRIASGNAASAPGSPYQSVSDAMKRFDSLPNGRRAILLISDGLDTSRGVESASPGQNPDLDQAILQAQQRGVAIYSFFSTATATEGGNSTLVLFGQGSLERLADETGGRAFFQGTSSPVSFDPFFRDLNLLLKRQFALTFLSTHLQKGYHKIQITSTNPQVRIEHPKGYYSR